MLYSKSKGNSISRARRSQKISKKSRPIPRNRKKKRNNSSSKSQQRAQRQLSIPHNDKRAKKIHPII